MWAAAVRFAELSFRLALAVLLFLLLPWYASRPWAPQLPSAPAEAPIVVPLPDVATDVWQSRGHVVHQEPYDTRRWRTVTPFSARRGARFTHRCPA